MQLLFSFDQDMTVEKTLIQTLACQLSSTLKETLSCSRLTDRSESHAEYIVTQSFLLTFPKLSAGNVVVTWSLRLSLGLVTGVFIPEVLLSNGLLLSGVLAPGVEVRTKRLNGKSSGSSPRCEGFLDGVVV